MQVTKQISRHTFPPGSIIIQEGAPPENFYIITEGEVEVDLRASKGEEFVVARMGKGQYVGEVELLRGGNSLATVVTSMKSWPRPRRAWQAPRCGSTRSTPAEPSMRSFLLWQRRLG